MKKILMNLKMKMNWIKSVLIVALLFLCIGVTHASDNQKIKLPHIYGTGPDYKKIDLPLIEVELLKSVGEKYNLRGDQLTLLFVIRKIEDGRPGREMGVLYSEGRKFDNFGYRDGRVSLIIQAERTAQTIILIYRGNLKDFQKIWAPIGAKNDPKNLNKHWVPRAKKYMEAWSIPL